MQIQVAAENSHYSTLNTHVKHIRAKNKLLPDQESSDN